MNVFKIKRRRWRHLVFISKILFVLWICDIVYSKTTPEPYYAANAMLYSNMCRTVFRQNVYYCPEEFFDPFASLSCYEYIPNYVIPPLIKWGIQPRFQKNICLLSVYKHYPNDSYFLVRNPNDYDIYNESSEIYSTFQTEKDKKLWKDCHSAALRCCQTMLSKNQSTDPTACPRTWDGWQCFEDTPAGEETEADCPEYIYFRSDPPLCPRKMQKQCRPEGYNWTSHPNYPDGEWTNYAFCQDRNAVLNRHYVHVGSFIISLVALAPAIFIFFIYKQLRVPRITMHKNLFISIFINAIVFIVFKWLIIIRELTKDESDNSLVNENSGWCKFLFMLTKYTRATNYMWMFCEGFYLHRLIVAAFAEQKKMLMYYLIGWGFPIIPVTIYSIIRIIQADTRCWTYPLGGYEWILNAPNLCSLMVNFLFLCNIIRVLVTKLRASNTNEPSQYRKAVRATLVLVPLFGLHFFVTIYRPSSGACQLLESYFYINYIIDGLQGFLVALMFCYLNGEVIQLIKRSITRWRLQHVDGTSSFSVASQRTTFSSFSTSSRSLSTVQALSEKHLNSMPHVQGNKSEKNKF